MCVIPFIVWPTPFIREPDYRTVAAGSPRAKSKNDCWRHPPATAG